ncbi:MAG: methyltransferase [Bacteroidales bacterium]|nr:methyltransferase [Bacteroidales bacterium]
MANPFFRFKQFTVWHDHCAMKVNTDGVLLGSWAFVDSTEYILDIGTGSGLIALMMAQRFTQATIHAVEIDEEAYLQARNNVLASPWNNRIEIIQNDFLNYQPAKNIKYDLIVSNPPYFTNSLKNIRRNKTIARHSENLPFGPFLEKISQLLNTEGIFAVILPAENKEFEQEALIHGLNCTKQLFIRTLSSKIISRQMLQFSKIRTQSIQKSELSIYKFHDIYSEEYIQLTREFYLNF